MPYLLGDLDDRQTYHPRKLLREAHFSGSTYNLSTRRLERAEFVGGALAIRPPTGFRMGGLRQRLRGVATGAAKRVGKVAGAVRRSRVGQAIGRGVQGAIKRARTGIGMAARTGLGRGIGRVAARATGVLGGAKRMRGVGNAFRSARKFSGPYLLSDFAEARSRQHHLPARFTR